MRIRSVSAMCAVWAAGTTVLAANIPAGYDLLQTDVGTYFDFGPGIGVVNFHGLPFDPVNYPNADTRIIRHAPAIFPFFGDEAYPGTQTPGTDVTIPIEMVDLSLESDAPVVVGDSFFDVWVTLDPNVHSDGFMHIQHQWNDDGDIQGTFESSFTIFANALFVRVGGGADFTIPIGGLTLSSAGTLWGHWGPAMFIPQVIEQHPGVGVHVAHSVPAPAGAGVGLCGAFALAARRRRN